MLTAITSIYSVTRSVQDAVAGSWIEAIDTVIVSLIHVFYFWRKSDLVSVLNMLTKPRTQNPPKILYFIVQMCLYLELFVS